MVCRKSISAAALLLSGGKNQALIAGVGAFAVLMYPAIGTVMAWCLGLSDSTARRLFQAAILLGGVAMLTAYALGNIERSVWRSFAKRFAIACAAFAVLVVSAGNVFQEGISFNPEALIFLGITATFFAASTILITCVPSIGTQERLQLSDNLNHGSTPSESVLRAGLQIIGWVLAVMVWYRGPEHTDGSVHLAMFANPSLLGIGFLAIFLALTFFQSALACLPSAPWLYLALFTTSRLVLLFFLVGIVLQFATFMVSHLQNNKIRLASLMNIPAAVLLSILLVGAPFVSNSICFPYLSSYAKPEVRTELILRFARLLRIIGFSAAVDAASQKSAVSKGLLETALYSAAVVEDRYELWRKAKEKIINEPLGQWPRVIQYPSVTIFPNAHKVLFNNTYPHNIVLETATLFGVLSSLTLVMGFVIAIVYLVLLTSRQPNIGAMLLLLGVCAELLRMQFSGSIMDSAGAMLALTFVSLLAYNQRCVGRYCSASKPRASAA